MRPPQKDYDVKPDFGTLLEKHRQYAFKRFMDVIGAKVDDLVDLLDRPLPFDQGPGKQNPYLMPAWFGPLSLTTSGRAAGSNSAGAPVILSGQDGFQTLAALANPARFVVPKNGDIFVGRTQSVRVMSLGAYGFVNWGYKSDPGFGVPYTNAQGVGDILDRVGPNPAVGENGGAMPMDYFGGTFSTLSNLNPNLPNISFEVELYDKTRGRRLHDGKLPVEMFQGGRIAHRKLGTRIKFEKGTTVEPRLFINEIRMGSILDGAAAFNAASVKVWVCLVFKGVSFVEIPNV